MNTYNPSEVIPFRLHDVIETLVPDRDWAVADLIPIGAVTVLTGDSGIGKSTVAQQIARSIVLGDEIWGRSVKPGPVVLVSYEDDRDEILRRFQRMGSVPPAPPLWVLGADQIGHRGPLVRCIDRSGASTTSLYEDVRRICANVRPRLLIVDPLANAFLGDENDRSQAQPAVWMLRNIAPEAAVLLVTHSSMTGLQSGKGGSGSTGWRAAARAQLNLTAGRDGHALALVKSNYSPTCRISLRLTDRGFEMQDRVAHKDIKITQKAARPWEAEGVSESTWRRRQRARRP